MALEIILSEHFHTEKSDLLDMYKMSMQTYITIIQRDPLSQNDLTVHTGAQIFFDKSPCLCAGNDMWTVERQTPKEGKVADELNNVLHTLIRTEKHYINVIQQGDQTRFTCQIQHHSTGWPNTQSLQSNNIEL